MILVPQLESRSNFNLSSSLENPVKDKVKKSITSVITTYL